MEERTANAVAGLKSRDSGTHAGHFARTVGKRNKVAAYRAAEIIAGFDNATIDKVQEGPYLLNPDYKVKGEESVTITTEDLEVSTDEIPGYEVASKGTLTVALDITITDDLKKEGDAREIVNRIQNVRKDQNFELTDRIIVTISENAGLMASINQFKDYICREILADSLEFVPQIEGGIEIEVNEAIVKLNVLKKV